MKKMILLAMVLLLTSCGVFSSDFADKNLQIGVERALRQGDFGRKDYDKITHLDLSFLGIESLEGLEKLENLESLDLSDNLIIDIALLKELKALKILDLQNNYIEDISVLSELTALEVLLLRNNPIESIEVIEPLFKQLKNTDFLTEINFKDAAFEDYIRSVLMKPEDQVTYYDLDRIKSIDLTDTEVVDISGIEHAHSLEKLIVPHKVDGLEQLIGLENIKHLVLRENAISSIHFIKAMKKLNYLDLGSNKISQIEVLEQMGSLEYLDISYNKIEDVSYLNELTHIESLYLNGNYLSDYTVIEDLLAKVIETDVYIVFFKDVNLNEAIKENLNKKTGVITEKELKRITTLNVSNYGIEDLGGIELLENLVELDVSYNNLNNLDALKDQNHLKILRASNNQIDDIEGLKYVPSLSILDLRHNMISTVDSLVYLEALDYLLLEGNTIEESSITDSIKEKVKYTDEW